MGYFFNKFQHFSLSILVLTGGVLVSPGLFADSAGSSSASSSAYGGEGYTNLAPELPGPTREMSIYTQGVEIERYDLVFNNLASPTTAVAVVDASANHQFRFFELRQPTEMEYDAAYVYQRQGKLKRGATADIQLFKPLKLSAGYLSGNNHWDVPVDQMDRVYRQSTQSWNLAADGQWGKGVSTRVEYARSQQQAGWGLDDTSTAADDALYAEIKMTSYDQPLGWLDYWNGKLEYRSVGAEYYSMDHWSLVQGQKTQRLLFDTSVQGIDLALEWQRHCQCANEEQSQQARRHQRAGLRLKYAYQEFPLIPALGQLLGTPKLEARYYQIGEHEAPAVVWQQGYGTAGRGEEMGVNLRFDHNWWRWYLDYAVTEQDNFYQTLDAAYEDLSPLADWQREATSVRVALFPSERLKLNVNASWSRQSEVLEPNDYYYRNYGIEARLAMIPDTLSMAVSYYLGRESQIAAAEQLLNARNQSGNARLSWHAAAVKGERPGFDIYLRSSFNRHVNEMTANDELQWSAHLGVEIDWGSVF